MITEGDLLNLRYSVVTRLEDNDNTVEFIHQDLKEKSYLVKLRKGNVNTVHPTHTMRCCELKSIDELKNWHFSYISEFKSV